MAMNMEKNYSFGASGISHKSHTNLATLDVTRMCIFLESIQNLIELFLKYIHSSSHETWFKNFCKRHIFEQY